jgi:hypothetical protein
MSANFTEGNLLLRVNGTNILTLFVDDLRHLTVYSGSSGLIFYMEEESSEQRLVTELLMIGNPSGNNKAFVSATSNALSLFDFDLGRHRCPHRRILMY